jgi:TonB family protein
MKHVLRRALLSLLAVGSQVLAAEPAPETAPAVQPPPKPASECKLQPVKILNPDRYYPGAERTAGHAGVIVVEFTVMTSPGKPVDLRVDTSSGFPGLDAAALRVIGDSSFKTLCPGERAKVAVRFGSSSGH